jgi:hypothetical protein
MDFIDGIYYFECPHCKALTQVLQNEVNCQIFRHGAFKLPGTPSINPHLPQAECERLVSAGLVYGCGKPFRLIVENGRVVRAVECGYI